MISQEKDGKLLQQDAIFDILSLIDQLHCSKSTNPKGLEEKKINFLEDQIPNLIDLGQTYLTQAIALYNKIIERE